MSNFYEELDIVFDELYEIHGLIDELINYKSIILLVYEKERAYTHISSKKIFVDENGYVTLMEK
jgi:hypothetical protein